MLTRTKMDTPDLKAGETYLLSITVAGFQIPLFEVIPHVAAGLTINQLGYVKTAGDEK